MDDGSEVRGNEADVLGLVQGGLDPPPCHDDVQRAQHVARMRSVVVRVVALRVVAVLDGHQEPGVGTHTSG